jgi:hypothetical protein
MGVRLITFNLEYCLIFSVKLINNFIFLIVHLEFPNINNQLQGLLSLI